MIEENVRPEFKLKNIKETINYFIKEIYQNKLMSKNNKKVLIILNYIEQFLILASAAIGCDPISAFAYLAGILIGVTNSVMGLKTCATTAGIKNYKSVIQKKKNKPDKIVLLV